MSEFNRLYGRNFEVAADAPGRVNLIGEHTDYSGGFVLPVATPQRTRVEVARRADRLVRVASAGARRSAPAVFALEDEEPIGDWVDYVAGVVVALRQAGHPVFGFDAWITSELPWGSGLSSSAALELSLLRALRDAFALPLDDLALARLGCRAENDFVGAPVGMMDQMAAAFATEHEALFLDTRALTFETVRLPSELELLVIDSGVAHRHAQGEYRARRRECERAARLLGVPELRDVRDLDATKELPPPLDRRARHVVCENARVLDAVSALRRGHLEHLGTLLVASHASLRDDYEVSAPDVDRLVAGLLRERGVFGARMTGGGFGGAVVALVERGRARDVGRRSCERYDAGGTVRGKVLIPRDGSSSQAAAVHA